MLLKRNFWLDSFCKEYINADPKVAKNAYMPVVDSLDQLPSGEDLDHKTPGWWKSSQTGINLPVTDIKNFSATCDASKELRLQGTTSDGVIILSFR